MNRRTAESPSRAGRRRAASAIALAGLLLALFAPLPAAAPPGTVSGYGDCRFNQRPALPGGETCDRPYSDASPFNRALPRSPARLPRSDLIVSRTVDFGPPPLFVGGAAGSIFDWGRPIFYARPHDPLFSIQCAMASAWGPCSIEGERIRIPDAARAPVSGDGHMAVIDRRSGWEYDFWQVRQKPSGGGRLLVGYGGRTRIEGSKASGLGSPATAAHFGLAAGIVRPQELQAGIIDHALFMIVKCTNGTSVWPAGPDSGRSCSSIGLSNAGAPAMGQHFYLDMTEAQIDALRQPAWRKTILRAMARYGLYVGDTGSPGWNIGVESGTSYTSFGQPDPWAQLGRRLGIPSNPAPTPGRRHYRFDLGHAVDWRAQLEVARVCVTKSRCAA